MYVCKRSMGPVPCIALRDLWDRSHVWLSDNHGTGPILQLGLHIITSLFTWFTDLTLLASDLVFPTWIFDFIDPAQSHAGYKPNSSCLYNVIDSQFVNSEVNKNLHELPSSVPAPATATVFVGHCLTYRAHLQVYHQSVIGGYHTTHHRYWHIIVMTISLI